MGKRKRHGDKSEIRGPLARPLPPGLVPGINVGRDAEAYTLGDFLAIKDVRGGKQYLTLVGPDRRPTFDECREAMFALYPDVQITMGVVIPPKGAQFSKPNTVEMEQLAAVRAKRVVGPRGRQLGVER